MNLDLREVSAVYINLKKDVKKDFAMKALILDCGFKNTIRVEAEYTPNSLSLIHISEPTRPY